MDGSLDPDPTTTFEEMGLDPRVLQGVREVGYRAPLPVQAASFGAIRAGRHVVVQSRTGSGKTAAFALPLLHRIDPSLRDPQVLVLAPTRELALQVHEEFQRLGRYCDLLSVCIYGGTRYQEQLDALKAGVQVVVGTPGRVLDHQRRGTFRTSGIRTLVLDEADEMLSAGFYEDIRKVLGALPHLEQVLLFSATLPEHLMQLIGRFMPDAVRLDLSRDRVDVERIENVGYPVDPTGSKLRTLLAVLEAEDPRAAIIFCNTRAETERVTAYLRRRGFDAALLNSDLCQTDRERVMARMKSGQQRLLVATDIAARGIDISFLPCVIHFDLPQDVQQYIHRTGRTGRVDRVGRAISLLTLTDTQSLRRLEWTYGIRIRMLETPSREETLKMLAERRVRELREMLEAGRVIPEEFLAIAQEILEDPEALRLVASLVDAWLTTPAEKEQTAPPASVPAPDRPPASPNENGPQREGGRRRRR